MNQHLKLGERAALKELATAVSVRSIELYHLERLRNLLDSPRGCGLRLEYLRLPMTPEEQLAYWSSASTDVDQRLARIEGNQLRILQRLETTAAEVISRTTSLVMDLRADLSSTLLGQGAGPSLTPAALVTPRLDIPWLLWLHRLVMRDSSLPEGLVGVLRTMDVTVESVSPDSRVFMPPSPEEVPELLRQWCADWAEKSGQLVGVDRDAQLNAVVGAYYELLRIHPFTDGNGRLALAVPDQLLREYLSRPLPGSFVTARSEHQQALVEAENGDLTALRDLLVAALA